MKRYLVIGLGSMGKRRIRCLQRLGVPCNCIVGIDVREDRCSEAEKKYNIQVAKNEDEIDFLQVVAVIVSLPPDRHYLGVDIALRHEKPVFVEASVMLEDVIRIRDNNSQGIFIAPSCTLIFHPMIKKIKEIVISEKYGKACNFSYHCGQYLPDWHPWESINDFYVSKRETGGAREIVPFELTWLVDIFGYPNEVKGYCRKTRDLGCDIEDTYACTIDYEKMAGTLLVDVVGRNAIRTLIINFEEAQLQWRWESKRIEIFDAELGKWEYIYQAEDVHEEGYNANIGEDMYVKEIDAFLQGIEGKSSFPNTIEKDIAVLKLLCDVEKSDERVDV